MRRLTAPKPETVRRSPFAVSPFTVHRSPFTVHRSPFTVHGSPFTVRRSPAEPAAYRFLDTFPWPILSGNNI
jgi:hypothetical protein